MHRSVARSSASEITGFPSVASRRLPATGRWLWSRPVPTRPRAPAIRSAPGRPSPWSANRDLRHHSLANPVAVNVIDRTARAFMMVDQPEGRRGRVPGDAAPAGDRSGQRGLARTEGAVQPDDTAGRQLAPEAFSLALHAGKIEHPHRRPGRATDRETLGALAPRRSLSWSRSIAASSNSRLAEASRICCSRAAIAAARCAGSCRSTVTTRSFRRWSDRSVR